MRGKLPLVIVILVGILPVFFIWTMDYLPFTDYPNHLVRVNIVKSYEASEFYRHYFSVDFFNGYLPIPNIIFDLFVTKLLSFVPIDTAGRIFLCLYVLLSISSVLLLCREIKADSEVVLMGYLPVIYSFFFNMALLNFIFSIPLVIFSIIALLRFRRNGRPFYLIMITGLLILVYLSHLFSFLLLSLILTGYSPLSKGKYRTVIYCLAFFCITAIVIYLAQNSFSVHQHPLQMKYKLNLLPLFFLSYPANNYDQTIGMLILIIYTTGLLWMLISLLMNNRRMLILILVVLILYLLLPFSSASVTFIDARLLPFLILLILMASNKCGKYQRTILLIIFSVAILLKAYGSFVYYSAFLNKFPGVMECADKIETGSVVLPVDSADTSEINAYVHAWGYAILKKDFLTPYIFAGKYQPLKYRNNLFAPSQLWGHNEAYNEPDKFWDNLKKTYGYILIFGKNENLRVAIEKIGYKILCRTEMSTLYYLKDK
jgi:hypothetical protein